MQLLYVVFAIFGLASALPNYSFDQNAELTPEVLDRQFVCAHPYSPTSVYRLR